MYNADISFEALSSLMCSIENNSSPELIKASKEFNEYLEKLIEDYDNYLSYLHENDI